MTRPLYLDCTPFMAEQLAVVASGHADLLDLHMGDPPEETIADLAQGRAVLLNGHTYMDAALLARLPELRRIVFLGSGASSYIDMAAATAQGIAVDVIAGYGDRAVAEHAFALMLAAARQVAAMDRDLRAGRWEPLEGIELGGRTVGVLGYGGIAREFAGLAAGFGMTVLVWSRRRQADCPYEQVPLEELLPRADVVSLHLALTEETRGFLGGARIGAMKPGAILVNTARAGLVDDGALLVALRDGRLRHAALDVFDQEPLAKDSPWPGAPRATLSAHAGFKTPEAGQRLLRRGLALAGIG